MSYSAEELRQEAESQCHSDPDHDAEVFARPRAMLRYAADVIERNERAIARIKRSAPEQNLLDAERETLAILRGQR